MSFEVRLQIVSAVILEDRWSCLEKVSEVEEEKVSMAARLGPLLLLILLALLSDTVARQELFSSLQSLKNALSMEQEALDGLQDLLSAEEDMLLEVQNSLVWSSRLQRLHKNVLPNHEYDFVNRFLHLSHLARGPFGKRSRRRLKKLFDPVSIPGASWPQDHDFRSAALSICGLQQTYNLSVERMLSTELRSPRLPPPTPWDMIELAVSCQRNDGEGSWNRVSSMWASAARRLARFSGDIVTARRAEHALFDAEFWEGIDPASLSIAWELLRDPPETLRMQMYKRAFLGLEEEKNNVPENSPSSWHANETTTFASLCAARRLVPPRLSPSRCHLWCGKDSLLLLEPFKVEVLRIKPRIWLLHDFLNSSECEELRRLTGNGVTRQMSMSDVMPEGLASTGFHEVSSFHRVSS